MKGNAALMPDLPAYLAVFLSSRREKRNHLFHDQQQGESE